MTFGSLNNEYAKPNAFLHFKIITHIEKSQ